MPTSADFYVKGATEEDLAKLDQALRYIDSYMPYNGAPVMAQLAELGITIAINNSRENSWDSLTRVLNWDPNAALVVVDSNGDWNGVNSAATILLHEAAHATDPNFDQNIMSENAAYENDAERYATNVASGGAWEAGEVERGNHDGALITTDNPTTHTHTFDNGDIAWMHVDDSMEASWLEFDYASYDGQACPSTEQAWDWLKPGDFLDLFPESRPVLTASLLKPLHNGRLVYVPFTTPVAINMYVQQHAAPGAIVSDGPTLF